MKLSELFIKQPDGQLRVVQTLLWRGIHLRTGSSISANAVLNGVSLAEAWDQELITELRDDIVVIQGIKPS